MRDPISRAMSERGWVAPRHVLADRSERFIRMLSSGVHAITVNFEVALDPAHLDEARAAAVTRRGEVAAARCDGVARVHDAHHTVAIASAIWFEGNRVDPANGTIARRAKKRA